MHACLHSIVNVTLKILCIFNVTCALTHMHSNLLNRAIIIIISVLKTIHAVVTPVLRQEQDTK